MPSPVALTDGWRRSVRAGSSAFGNPASRARYTASGAGRFIVHGREREWIRLTTRHRTRVPHRGTKTFFPPVLIGGASRGNSVWESARLKISKSPVRARPAALLPGESD